MGRDPYDDLGVISGVVTLFSAVVSSCGLLSVELLEGYGEDGGDVMRCALMLCTYYGVYRCNAMGLCIHHVTVLLHMI